MASILKLAQIYLQRLKPTVGGDGTIYIDGPTEVDGEINIKGDIKQNGEVPPKPNEVAIFMHQSSGNVTAGTPGTTPLNVVQYNGIVGASLVGYQIELPAGTYEIDFVQYFFRVNWGGARLVDMTQSQQLIVGQNSYADSSGDGSSDSSHGTGIFTFNVTTRIEMQFMYSTSSSYEIGYGSGLSWNPKTHSYVKVRRLA